MKKILITGGCGFIGSALVKKLVQDGNKVKVLDNCSRGSASRLKNILNDIEFIQGDIRDFSVVSKACENIEHIHHLAYINGTENFYKKPELVLDVAASGIINLYHCCKEKQIEEFYLASTSEVYQTPTKFPAAENERLIIPDIMNPRYSYGGGKILCELVAIHCIQKLVKKLIIYRPHNVYGPDMGNEHVIPQFFIKMKKLIEEFGHNKVINFPIQGSGDETRSFIHINDFIKGVGIIINKGENNQIYHIGNSDEVSIKKLATLISKTLDISIEIKQGELQLGSTIRRCPDIKKISSIGYRQTISLEEGIASLKRWYY